MTERGRSFGRGAAGALLLLLAACAGEPPLDREGPAPFADRKLTWAQGDLLHHGQVTFDIGDQAVLELRPSSYGFFLLLGDPGDPLDGTGHEWHLFDGETLEPLGEGVEGVQVSPDGRLAGWVDRHGPLRPAGRIAKVVVVDLATGEVLLDEHDGMGGGFGDDLDARYSELPPTFLGFDDRHAYWSDAEGHGTRKRWERDSGEITTAEGADGRPSGHPYDAYAGEGVGLVDGVVGREGTAASLSPDRRFAAETGSTGRLRVYDADGHRLPLRLGHPHAVLGGWLEGDRLYAMTRDRFEEGFDPTAVDRTRGFLTTCSLRTGGCRDVQRLRGTWHVVLPATSPLLL